MKSEKNMTPELTSRDIDAGISALLNKELPRANSNPWFTPRVMNRLPEQSRWAGISLWQWVCYLLGFAGIIASGVFLNKWLVYSELSLDSLLAVSFMSLLVITCAAVLMVPSLVRILREP